MTSAALAGPAAPYGLVLPFEELEEPRASDGGRLTLERKLDSVWEGLLAAGVAGCPVCDGRMERSGAAATCRGCGTRLS